MADKEAALRGSSEKHLLGARGTQHPPPVVPASQLPPSSDPDSHLPLTHSVTNRRFCP